MYSTGFVDNYEIIIINNQAHSHDLFHKGGNIFGTISIKKKN